MNPINSIFMAQEITSTGKKGSQNIRSEMRSPKNKYDDLLKNNIVKSTTANGSVNAVNTNPLFRRASEDLDALYQEKLAQSSDDYRNNANHRGNANFQANHYKQRDAEPNNLVPVKSKKEDSINPILTALGIITGAGAAEAILQKSIKAPMASIRHGAKKFVFSVPSKVLKNSSSTTAKNVRSAMKQTSNELKRDRQKAAELKKMQEMLKRNGQNPKNAVSEDFCLLEKLAKINPNIKDKISRIGRKTKTVVRDDFLRPGLESVPYYAAPAILGYALNKDLRDIANDEDVHRVVVDVPLNKKTQKELFKNASESIGWSQWARESLPRRTLQGLGRSIFPAIVISATGRNIKGKLERIEKKQDDQDKKVKQGVARIIIETREKKASSDESENIPNDAAEEIEKRIELMNDEKTEAKKEKKSDSLQNYSDLRLGVLKKRRMIPFS